MPLTVWYGWAGYPAVGIPKSLFAAGSRSRAEQHLFRVTKDSGPVASFFPSGLVELTGPILYHVSTQLLCTLV